MFYKKTTIDSYLHRKGGRQGLTTNTFTLAHETNVLYMLTMLCKFHVTKRLLKGQLTQIFNLLSIFLLLLIYVSGKVDVSHFSGA